MSGFAQPRHPLVRDAGRDIAAPYACKIRLLVFTSLYPNVEQPHAGIFVEERLRRLLAAGGVEATVVAPVPWFPFRHPRFGAYAAFARVPAREQRNGITVLHPRFRLIPKVGMNLAPGMMARALLPVLRQLLADGTVFDLIDAHYFYPDGVAAVRLGMALSKPVVISARGSDVTLIPRYRKPRQQIQWAAARAAAVITVSHALRAKLVALGVGPDKITVLRNGVDLEEFGLRARAEIRSRLGLVGPVWLTVGSLIELKGVHLAIEALAQVPDTTLLIAGDGPERHRLHQMVDRLRLSSQVRFLGVIPHEDLCDYYNAADVLVLASSREGMSNVALESLACGTPVLAAPFDGAGELVAAPAAGRIAASRSAAAVVAAWTELRENYPSRAATRRYAERFGWGATVKAQQAVYDSVCGTLTHGAQTAGRRGQDV